MRSDPDLERTLSELLAKRRDIAESVSGGAPPNAPPLHSGAESSSYNSMSEVDAKIAAAEARTDTKLAKMDGKLDLILLRLASIESDNKDAKGEARTTRRTVVGTGISLAALLIAIASLTVNSFNIGSRVDEIARTAASQSVQRALSPPAVSQLALPAPSPSSTPKAVAK